MIIEFSVKKKKTFLSFLNLKREIDFNHKIYQKVFLVFISVIVLTFLLFLLIKILIDLAIRNKIELIQMKDSYIRIVTEEYITNLNREIIIYK